MLYQSADIEKISFSDARNLGHTESEDQTPPTVQQNSNRRLQSEEHKQGAYDEEDDYGSRESVV